MNIHIGEKIKARTKELKLGTTEFGMLIHTSKQNVYGIFKRKTIDAELLYSISLALRHDFFHYYYTPELEKLNNNRHKEIEELKRKNDKLKTELKAMSEKYKLLEKVN